jgi:hypothetical protein
MGLVATLTVARLETNDSTSSTLCHRLTYLLGTVARTWLQSAATVVVERTSNGSSSSANDDNAILSASTVASHAKAAQRILWSAATNTLHNRDPIDCLRLQQLAIELYLLLPNSLPQESTTPVVLSADVQAKLQGHFATACTMAWKASESFLLVSGDDNARASAAPSLQTPQPRNGDSSRFAVVSAFHARLGQHLDRMAAAAASGWDCTDEPPLVVPGSYYEYCAYRALHASRCLDSGPPPQLDSRAILARDYYCSAACVFSGFAFPCPHHVCCSDSATAVPTTTSVATTSVALVYLALAVRNGLEALMQTDPQHTVAIREAVVSLWPVSQADAIQFTFQQWLKSTTTIEKDGGTFGGLRLYKVLSALSLHKILQTFVSRQSDKRIALQPFALALCHTAMTLLANCVGPLCFWLSSTVEGKQKLSIASAGVASLRSAIALSELLHGEAALDSLLVSTTNRWMRDLVHQLTSQQRQPSVELMETTARVRHQNFGRCACLVPTSPLSRAHCLHLDVVALVLVQRRKETIRL